MAGWREFAGTVLLLPAVSAIVAGFAAGSPVVGAVPDEDPRRLMTGARPRPRRRRRSSTRRRAGSAAPHDNAYRCRFLNRAYTPLRDRVQRLRRHHCSRREDRR
ncbi:hypothetical protein [Actinoallomurus oryzae]|uniref:hypothetical protein n=1 Tax=Actinoallomurus oryzae TaxID=502180 RepID=UPI0031F127A8